MTSGYESELPSTGTIAKAFSPKKRMILRFDTPEHGWMRVQVNDFALDVSDVPCDSLTHLTKILARLLSGSITESVDWSLEPEYARWIFNRSGDQLEWRMQETLESEAILIERGSLIEIADQIIVALSDLQNNPCWSVEDSESEAWSWPFPSIELERLQAKRAESEPG